MKEKFICTVCGYIYEGTEAPEECPICHAKANKFKAFKSVELKGTKTEKEPPDCFRWREPSTHKIPLLCFKSKERWLSADCCFV